MKRITAGVFIILAVLLTQAALAAQVTIHMELLSPQGNQPVGTVVAEDTQYGLLLIPRLTNLSPGIHGFHVHQYPSCADNGMAAGGHLDPQRTNKHLGPYNAQGHLGDLPALLVEKDGKAVHPVLAPRLKVADILEHSLMIHVGGDNYSDNPSMGGGGMRMVCGVIKKH